MSKHQARFSQLPRAAVIDTSLSSTDFKVLAIIGLYLNHDREAWPSQDTIAEVGDMSRRTVIRAIKSLEQAGYIESKKKYPNRPGTHKCYRVVMSRSDKSGTSVNATEVTSECDTALSLPIRTSPVELTTPNGVDARETRKPPKAKKVTKRGSRIAETWAPTPVDYAHASKKGLTPQEINHEADQFRDYHIAKGTVSKDWAASWRTWCRNAAKWKSERKPSARADRHAARDAVFDQVADQFDYGPDAGREGGEHYHPHASSGGAPAGGEATLFDADGAQLTWNGGSGERAA